MNDVNYTGDSEDNERDTEENESEGVELEGIGSENLTIGLRRDPGRPRKVLTGQCKKLKKEYNIIGPAKDPLAKRPT